MPQEVAVAVVVVAETEWVTEASASTVEAVQIDTLVPVLVRVLALPSALVLAFILECKCMWCNHPLPLVVLSWSFCSVLGSFSFSSSLSLSRWWLWLFEICSLFIMLPDNENDWLNWLEQRYNTCLYCYRTRTNTGINSGTGTGTGTVDFDSSDWLAWFDYNKFDSIGFDSIPPLWNQIWNIKEGQSKKGFWIIVSCCLCLLNFSPLDFVLYWPVNWCDVMWYDVMWCDVMRS